MRGDRLRPDQNSTNRRNCTRTFHRVVTGEETSLVFSWRISRPSGLGRLNILRRITAQGLQDGLGARSRGALGASPNSGAHHAAIYVLFKCECMGRTEATLALCRVGLLSRFGGFCRPRSIHERLVVVGSNYDSISARRKKYLV